ncbi:MAG: hypothetical protein ACKV2Q_25535, partial [Planctomycetaceae bacterium]
CLIKHSRGHAALSFGFRVCRTQTQSKSACPLFATIPPKGRMNLNYSITGTVTGADLIAYRPQHGAGGYLPFLKARVANAEEEDLKLGPGIRLNGDDDNGGGVKDRDETTTPVNRENDLIELEVRAAGGNYVLARSVPALKVWTRRDKRY